MFKIYGDRFSGNCYKGKLLLSLLGQGFEWVDIDILKGESRTPEFLAMNPNGKVPVLEIAPGTWLGESNAILCYLADGTPYLPDDRLVRARVFEWLFFEQYSHEPYIATYRYWIRYLGKAEEYRARYESKQPGGYAALGVMERALAERDWLAAGAGRCTIADVALYAYTHVAHEGEFD